MAIGFITPRLPLVLGAGAVRAALPDGAFPGVRCRGGITAFRARAGMRHSIRKLKVRVSVFRAGTGMRPGAP